MQRDKIIDKIEKLMRRTREAGASEAEAESAIAMAHKLMDQHNIELSEIELERAGTAAGLEVVEEEARTQASNVGRFENTLIAAVTIICGVKVYLRTSRVINKNGRLGKRVSIVFYGTRTDVAVARLLLNELFIVTRALARGRLGKGWTQQHWRYCEGFAMGIYQQAKQQEEQQKAAHTSDCRALITTKQLKLREYEEGLGLSQTKGGRPKVNRAANAAYQHGVDDGRAYDVVVDKKSRVDSGTAAGHLN